MNVPDVSRHEALVINGLLQDSSFVHWGLTNLEAPGEPWLQPADFRTPLLADMYEVLRNAALQAPNGYLAKPPAVELYQGLWNLYQARAAQGDPAAQRLIADRNAWEGQGGLWEYINHLQAPQHGHPSTAYEHAVEVWNASPRQEPLTQAPPSPGDVQGDIQAWGALAIVGAVLHDPGNAEAFRYQPQDPTASPYWLQGEDFDDEFLNVAWQALVTGPNAVINSEAAHDPYLVGDARVITLTRLTVDNMQAILAQRAPTDPAAAQALSDPTFRERAELLLQDQNASLAHLPPDQLGRHARYLVLDPHIRNYVAQLGEQTSAEIRSAGPVGQGLLATLARSVAAIQRLRERVNSAAAPTSVQNPRVRVTRPETAYATPARERAIIDAALRSSDFMRTEQYRALRGEDFTVPEHRALFEAMQRHPTPWHPLLLVQEAHLTSSNAQPLNGDLMVKIASAAYADAPRIAPPTDGGPQDPRVMAQQLVTVTLRRSTEQANTVVTKAAHTPQLSTETMLGIAAQQYTQAAQSALRYNPTPGHAPRQPQQPQSGQSRGQFAGV
ncbi:hypothetical protein [Streptomyces sp. S1D4-20]|uniref:hypothetical protein n=1 Tax=Streptomyces sp. S1D4-20 TaxID=2594462 RepID=UPI0011645779|nr:hypothetical protein [Streptomyces sp. S1D4-20]QDN54190.1 hypothetical protein FNV67_01060 [Streptomyces sp. S1D4-20]